jgi:hypothetical protein
MGTLDTAIDGLNRIQAEKMAAAKHTTPQVNDIAVNAAKSEGSNTPNDSTSPGSHPNRT